MVENTTEFSVTAKKKSHVRTATPASVDLVQHLTTANVATDISEKCEHNLRSAIVVLCLCANVILVLLDLNL